ncbi:hypothetical protein U9M48_036932 [Paspalum notatum var. saurae]|uniref:Uncharacterized protein n=1 Tax=Paspalum notatum var. saurae TaxID=547442 RepID=A0AAQ3UE07_PASNO
MVLFDEFHKGGLELNRLNFASKFLPKLQLIELSKWPIKSSDLHKRLSFLEEIFWKGLWSCMRLSTSSIGKISTGHF